MEDGELDLIVRALRKLKEERHYSLEGLARLLGFSTSHLCMIFAGQRHPGLRLVRSVMRHFPEIRALIATGPSKKTPL
jgi:hypothetical protein